jgi:hypothetical protein
MPLYNNKFFMKIYLKIFKRGTTLMVPFKSLKYHVFVACHTLLLQTLPVVKIQSQQKSIKNSS